MLSEREMSEFELLSIFLRERLPATPSGGRDLVEYLNTFKEELQSLDISSDSVRVLVDGYVAMATAELRSIAIKERLWAVCIVLVIVGLFALALVIPYADHSLAEALGR